MNGRAYKRGLQTMFEVPYDKMVCDSDLGDGGLYFYNEYFEWVNRSNHNSFKIYYKDIQDVKILYGRKKTVIVSLNDGSSKRLYLYKADTLRMVIYQAIERLNGKVDNNNQETPLIEEPINEDDISKLERLAKLHESGALSDEEFIKAKKKIIG